MFGDWGFAWLVREWRHLKGRLLAFLLPSEEAWHIISAQIGKRSLEEQIAHWKGIEEWLQLPQGKTWQLQMEDEIHQLYEKLLDVNLSKDNDRALLVLVAQLKQQNKMATFPTMVAQTLKQLHTVQAMERAKRQKAETPGAFFERQARP